MPTGCDGPLRSCVHGVARAASGPVRVAAATAAAAAAAVAAATAAAAAAAVAVVAATMVGRL